MNIFKLDKWIKNKALSEWIEAILFAIIAAFIIRTWFYAPFRVPTGSMIPTIYVGDQLLADMNSYGYKIPFTNNKIGGDEINRGDIVIFPNPTNPKICERLLYSSYSTISSLVIGIFNKNYIPKCVDYIKRIIAIGGDHLQFNGEKVIINGKNESGYQPFFDPRLPPRNIYYQEYVPTDSVFVMGDNRRDSHDGRFWHIDGKVLSFVKKENIRSKGKFIYFSVDNSKTIFDGRIRWNRMFSRIN